MSSPRISHGRADRKSDDDQNRVQVLLQLSPNLLDKIRKEATDAGLRVAPFIRELLTQAYEQK